MNYLSDGYHFFTDVQKNNTAKQDNTARGMSLSRRHGKMAIEVFPEVARGAELVLLVDDAPNTPKKISLGRLTNGIVQVPFSQELNKIIGAAVITGRKATFAVSAKDNSLDFEKIFAADPGPSLQQEKLADNGKIYPFDPFGTTNPAYSWTACTSENIFKTYLSQNSITLPESLERNANSAFFKYHHTLLGNYTEEISGREFFIIGIPTDSSDHSCAYNDKYNAARFVEAIYPHGNTTYKGYHLYYIDKKSTALVKVVLKK